MPSNKDTLNKLIADADSALKRDESVPDAVMDGLRDLARDPDADIRRLATEAQDAVNNASMAQATKALAAVAAKLTLLGPSLDNATAVAAQGKANLFFPRVAKKAADALDKVTKLKQDIEALRQEANSLATSIGNVQELQDLPDALDKVKSVLEKLKDRAEKLKS